jgi:hypothetical protein
MVPAIVSYAVLTEATAGAAMEAFVAALPSRPPAYSGAGIVIPAGGLRYLVNAWVCVRMLRRHGCRLPVQLWHLGPQEMPGPFAGLFARVGAAHGPVPARLESRRFVFTPSGDDPQLIAFAPDGLIEANAPRSVSCWRVEGDELVLFGNDLRLADRLCHAGRMGARLSIQGGQTSLVPIG